MSVNDTLAFLASRQRFGWKLGLDNIQALLRIVGDPQIRLKCVHVAGTNGKGSTCAILESIMRQAGYKTGLYT
ncbi:MAG: bifunctional folylpolyglutamate synthase/dihydrofolate synthase, partial [Calditrichaeota bacterium]|nr:bifunctional folylpolyglutamate synthase/dihydrofolate synthase [Calditrichota bacterium]